MRPFELSFLDSPVVFQELFEEALIKSQWSIPQFRFDERSIPENQVGITELPAYGFPRKSDINVKFSSDFYKVSIASVGSRSLKLE